MVSLDKKKKHAVKTHPQALQSEGEREKERKKRQGENTF